MPIENEEEVVPTKDELKHALHNDFNVPSTCTCMYWFSYQRTLLRTIRKGHFIGWPLAPVKNINRYFPSNKETKKGHINHQR